MDTKSSFLLNAMGRHEIRGGGKSMTQNRGGGKMRKWSFVTMLMVVCLMFGGCGSSSESKPVAESSKRDYESEDASYEEDSSEEDFVEDEGSTEDDESETEEPRVGPAEAKGIIAMIAANTLQTTDIQVISINPSTGEQGVISTFHVKRREDETFDWSDTFYGNIADQFSDDFSKMAITKIFGDNNESHAGWIDGNDEFFDVTESIGAAQEQDFSNPDPVHQRSAGFKNEMFILYDDLDFFGEGFTREADLYYIPIENPSQGSAVKADENDLYFSFRDSAHGVNLPSWTFVTDWLSETTFIGDVYDEKVENPQSVIANLETGEQDAYIPDANRLNWSGVVSPEDENIAFLSVPENSNGSMELYTIPLSGGEPTLIPVAAADTLVDFTALTGDDYPYRWSNPTSGTSYSCYLLDWR